MSRDVGRVSASRVLSPARTSRDALALRRLGGECKERVQLCTPRFMRRRALRWLVTHHNTCGYDGFRRGLGGRLPILEPAALRPVTRCPRMSGVRSVGVARDALCSWRSCRCASSAREWSRWPARAVLWPLARLALALGAAGPC